MPSGDGGAARKHHRREPKSSSSSGSSRSRRKRWSKSAQTHSYNKIYSYVFERCRNCDTYIYLSGFKCDKVSIIITFIPLLSEHLSIFIFLYIYFFERRRTGSLTSYSRWQQPCQWNWGLFESTCIMCSLDTSLSSLLLSLNHSSFIWDLYYVSWGYKSNDSNRKKQDRVLEMVWSTYDIFRNRNINMRGMKSMQTMNTAERFR